MKRFAVFYMLFIIIWFAGAGTAMYFWGESTLSSLGIGVASGIFVAEFRLIINKIVESISKDSSASGYKNSSIPGSHSNST